VSLMRISSRRVVCIESIEGHHALRVTIEQGRTQPLHAGASSKILLAGIPEDHWDELLELPLERFTSTTITDLDTLRASIRAIRSAGYATSEGEIDTGAKAIAVPLKNELGETIAALSIEAPSSRMDEATTVRYLEILRREAAIIQHEFH